MRRVVFIMLLFALLALPAAAQDESDTHPLFEMMAAVPRSVSGVEGVTISYADYEALSTSREGLPQIASAAEFEAMSDEERSIWLTNFRRLNSGPSDLFAYFNFVLTDLPRLGGFSFFDIDRALLFGQPLEIGNVLAGTFDPEAVTAAFSAWGFAPTEIGGLPAVCHAEGCEEGTQHDLVGREPGNPFGGSLGRREPLVILPDLLLNSPVIEVAESMVAAYQGEQPSILDNVAYRTAAEAMTSREGELIQAQFINPLSLGIDPALLMMNEEAAEVAREVVAEYGELPSYELAVLADRQEGDQQVSLVVLVYRTEAAAQEAAQELASRLASFTPPSIGNQLLIIEERGGQVGEGYVYTASDGETFAAVVPITAALPPLEPMEGETTLTQPGLVFRTLIDALYRRELLPLVVDTTFLE